MNSESIFEFRSVMYLKEEIEKHKGKLANLSGLSENQVKQSTARILSHIKFISEENYPLRILAKISSFSPRGRYG